MGLKGLVPAFKISVDGSPLVASRDVFPIEITITDEEGFHCDMVSVVFGDPRGVCAIPRVGAKLRAEIGYENALCDFGEYFIDECEISGDGRMSIICKSIDFTETMRKLNTRTFPADKNKHSITIAEIAENVASQYGMRVSCDTYAKDVSFRKVHQNNESDIHFLTRLANARGCTIKIKENVVCFLIQGGKTTSGKLLPEIELSAGRNIISWRYSLRKSEEYKAVRAIWRSWREAKDKIVTVGDDTSESIYGIPYRFRTEKEARDAAEAKLKTLRNGIELLEIEAHGNTDIRAEYMANIKECRNGVNGKWLIKRAEHKVSCSGYTVSLRCERPS